MTNDEEFHSLYQLLQRYSPATLATAVEQYGIRMVDRFGRIIHYPKGKAPEYALTLLANEYRWASNVDGNNSYGDDRRPSEQFADPDNPYLSWGWDDKELPDLDAIEKGQDERTSPQQRAGETKRSESALLIVAALLGRVGINPSDRGVAEKLRDSMDFVDDDLDLETIRSRVKEIPELLKKRKEEREKREEEREKRKKKEKPNSA